MQQSVLWKNNNDSLHIQLNFRLNIEYLQFQVYRLIRNSAIFSQMMSNHLLSASDVNQIDKLILNFMTRVNCWEHKQCGKRDICPVTSFVAADGFLDGKNAGRACVYVVGTLCNNVMQGTKMDKQKMCAQCDFHVLLRKENRAQMSLLSFTSFVFQNICENSEDFSKGTIQPPNLSEN